MGTPRRILAALVVLIATSESWARAPADSAAVPSPASSSASPPAPSREQQLEERLKALEARYEAMDRRRAQEYDELSKKYESLKREVQSGGDSQPKRDARGNSAPAVSAGSTGGRSTPEGGAGAEDNPNPETPKTARKAAPNAKRLPLNASFGPGFGLFSDDDEFQFEFHYLGQVDNRQYTQNNQDPVASGFSFPRQRLYFSGRVTKPIEYYVTVNRAYGTLDIFDAFINYHYDDRLMFKVGRFKTPYSYEFYAMSAPDFVVMERSLFSSNFGPNRELGAMAWGQLFEKKLDYAAGVFNGNRLSFQDTNSNKAFIAYMNARPFGDDGPESLQNLNIGGSVDVSNDSGVPLPNVFRTSIAASNAADAVNIAPPFLAFNKNVVESGFRELRGAHIAYFYKHLTLMAEWDGGYVTYSRGSTFQRARVPIESYYVMMGYFLTGETLKRRAPIKPLKPFDVRPGKFGLGAWEFVARFSQLNIGQNVFTAGLADPNLWTSSLYMTDIGLNWYLNQYAKIYFDWEHAVFGNPVRNRQDGFHKTSDLFWVRFQVFF